MAEHHLKHGDSKRGQRKRLYRIWANMKSRCENKNKPDYKFYGAKGISVCSEWKEYISFKEWALQNGYAEHLTLDRINSQGNYCPKNCRWITIQEQQNNKINNHILEFNNEKHTINEWSRLLNIDRIIIKDRLRLGWSVEDALLKPVKHQNKGITFNNETHSMKEWSKITGISVKTLNYRYYTAKWSIEKMLTTPLKRKEKTNNDTIKKRNL